MDHSPKPSEIIETLITLVDEDFEGQMLHMNSSGEDTNVCNYCKHGRTTCKTCPFTGATKTRKALVEALAVLKTVELVEGQ